jgi:uncharacterized Zn-binding protein involved in type VI secretion
MRKALIVQGNPTTTRGLVIGGSAFGMTDNGKPFALYGDEATCGNCKGAFKIVGTATGRCYDGRAGVIEGDLVLCPCGRNRVMAGSNPGCFYEDDSGAAGAASTIATGGTTSIADAYDDRFILRGGDGRALAYTAYALCRETGMFEYGETDGDGHTHLLASIASAENINVYLAG